jgi:hypothetical protein
MRSLEILGALLMLGVTTSAGAQDAERTLQ